MNARRPSRQQRAAAKDPGEPVAAIPPGRFAKVWLSGKFIAFCQRHDIHAADLAECTAHTLARENPAGVLLIDSEPRDVRPFGHPDGD